MATKKPRTPSRSPRAARTTVAAAAPELFSAAPAVDVSSVVAADAAPVVAADAAPVVAVDASPGSAGAAPVSADASPVAVTVEAPVEARVSLGGLEADTTPAPSATPDHAAIVQRAYALYVARGGPAFDNWIQAERELRGRRA